jgi:hypothetical protein
MKIQTALTAIVTMSLVHLACAIRAPLNTGLATWWGKNLIGNYMQIQEQDLGALCKSAPFDTIYLAGMVDHFATRGMPSLHLNKFCNASNAFAGFMMTTNGFTLPKCIQVEEWIATCQAMGKKVLLSISPMHETLKSDADGIKSAQNVWNIFLGGSSATRPFGNVILDGIDLAHRTNEVGYIGFMSELRRLMDLDARPYHLGISPECAFPSPRFGPTYDNTILSNMPLSIDFLNLMHLSSQVCSWGNQDLFWQTTETWAKWLQVSAPQIRILSTFPIIGWGYEAWINAMTGDFVPVADIYNKSAVPRLKSTYGLQFGGVALHDSSADAYNLPCLGSTTRYSQIWSSQISLSIAEAGKNTVDQCVPRSGNPIDKPVPTVTTTRKATGTNVWKPTSGAVYQPGQQTSQGLSMGAMAGIGVGVSIAAVGIAVVIGLAVMRMRKGPQDEETPKSPQPDEPQEEKSNEKSVEKPLEKPAEKPVEKAAIQKTTTIPAAPKPIATQTTTQTQTMPRQINYAMMKPVKNSLK